MRHEGSRGVRCASKNAARPSAEIRMALLMRKCWRSPRSQRRYTVAVLTLRSWAT